MRVTKQRRTRSKVVAALLLPAIIFMWIVGWAFYWIGHQKETKYSTQQVPKRDNVTFTVANDLQEEPVEVSA